MNTEHVKLLGNLKEFPRGCYPLNFIKNNIGEITAVKCSCGKCHPVLGETLKWNHEISNDILLFMITNNISYARILAEQE